MNERLFCSSDLAAEIERAEAELMASCAAAARPGEPEAFALPVGSGCATYAGADSPFTKVAGLGFGDALTLAELAAVEAAFAEVGAPVSVELSTLAESGLWALLVDRGFQLVSFENVLARALDARDERAPLPEGVVTESASDVEEWVDVVVEGALHADDQGLPAPEELPRESLERAERQLLATGLRPYLGRLQGVVAGGAGWRPAGRLAQLGGAATLLAHRRRGVQGALLQHRLRDAAAEGCELAVVTTQPGSTSQHNVQRVGFELMYTRAVLVKDVA